MEESGVMGTDVISIEIPMAFKKRGGRKVIVLPDGSHGHPIPTATIDNTMIKAIARAFRWRDMLESCECCTIREIANAEKINESYVGRVLRLTQLAPDIVEAILDGRQPPELQMDVLLKPFPVRWGEQMQLLNVKS